MPLETEIKFIGGVADGKTRLVTGALPETICFEFPDIASPVIGELGVCDVHARWHRHVYAIDASARFVFSHVESKDFQSVMEWQRWMKSPHS